MLLCACSSSAAELRVDLRTDYAPGVEFDRVHVEVTREGVVVAAQELAVEQTDDFIVGARVADVEGMRSGLHQLNVTLSLAGTPRIEHRIVFEQPGGVFAITALITRNCEGIDCSTDALTQCLDGRCVDAMCSPTTPDTCPEPECMVNADCVATLDCGQAICAEGVCIEALDDSRCAAGVCDRILGCTSSGGDCATSLDCARFEPDCLSTLGRRCALLGVDGMLVRFVVYDPDSGDSCTVLSDVPPPGSSSGAPQLFNGSVVVSTGGDCQLWSLSMDAGDAARVDAPCGLPAVLDDTQLAWVEADGLGGGVIHIPGSPDASFMVPMNWGALWTLSPGEVALPQSDTEWEVVDLTSATVVETLTAPARSSGVWRDGDGLLWLTGSENNLEVVHVNTRGDEAPVPIQDLPMLEDAFSNYVGIGCAF